MLPWASYTLGFGNKDVQFGSTTADGMVEFQNRILLTGNNRFQICDNAAVKTDFVRFSGLIAGDNTGQELRFNESTGNNFYGGLVELTATNSYTRRTRIDGATVYALPGIGLPGGSQVRFSGNSDVYEAVLMANGTLNREINTTDGVYWDSRGGFAARGGTFTVTLESGANLDWSDGNAGFRGQVLQMGSRYADDAVEIVNDIMIDDNRYVDVFNNTDTDTDVAILSGDLTTQANPDNRLYIRRGGVLWMRGTGNTYDQHTVIDDESTLRVDSQANISPNTTILFDEWDRRRPCILEAKGSLTLNIGQATENGAICWDWQHGGFAAYGGPLAVNLESGVTIDPGTIDTGFEGHALMLGSYTANDVVDFQNDIWLNSRTHRFQVFDNPYSESDRSVYSGEITFTGWGDIEVGGDGVLEFTGTTSIRNVRVYETGTLCFNGSSHTCTDQIYTENNYAGALGGTGSVSVVNRFDIRNRGRLTPGCHGPGTLGVSVTGGNGFRMYDGSTYEWELGVGCNDKVDVTGNLELRTGWKLKLISDGGTPVVTDEYEIFTYTGSMLYASPEIDTSEMPEEWATDTLSVVHDFAGKRVYVTGLYTTLDIGNTDATDLTSVSAQLNGTLSCSGLVMTVWAYWGETDHGTNAGLWDHGVQVGSYTDVLDQAISHDVSGLDTNVLYYYAFRATNATKTLWATPSASFNALGPPVVDNDGGATSLRGLGTAKLHGTFNDHNRGDVTICWGLTDGGTNGVGDWDHADIIGNQADVAFLARVSGVYYPHTYYYRCYASNDYGVGWASTAETFAAPRSVAPGGDGLRVRGYDTENTTVNLAPITNLFQKTASGTDVQTDPIDYNSTTGAWYSGFSHVGITDPNNWSLLFDGYFVADETTTYTFGLDNDDGCVLYLDLNEDGDYDDANEYVINDNWGQGVGSLHTEEIALTRGVYNIAIGWYQGSGGYGVIAKWGKGSSLAWGDLDYIDGASDRYYQGLLGDPIAIANAQSTERTLNTAKLNATIDITNAAYEVWVYWGLVDGGTDPVSWASNALVGAYTGVTGYTVGYTIGGLSALSTPFYTFQLTNAQDSVWATPSTNVLPITTPTVDNGAGALTSIGSATLRGNLTAGSVADIYIYWGRSDGGEVPGNWDGYELLSDTPQGAFSDGVSAGHGFTYYYRCYAVNAAGSDWANSTESFSLPEPPTWEYVYEEGLRGSIFTGAPDNDTRANLGGSSYDISYSRIFTGDKADTVLAVAEDGNNNVIATGAISAWNNFPNTDGNIDHFVTAFSGRMFPRTTGSHTFRFNCDDRAWMWIDVDGDGVFETGEEVGTYAWTCNGSKTLTQGQGYNFVAMAHEYGGGQSMNWYVTEPGQSEAVVNTIDQAPLWQYVTGTRQLLQLANAPESNVSTNSATLNGTLTCDGRVFDLWVHWGETDGGTNSGDWDNHVLIGAYTGHDGGIDYALSGLDELTDYVYTFQATNAFTNVWAEPSEPFQTLGTVVITNLSVASLTTSSAELGGELVSGGSGDATIYWGLSDGGTDHAAWEHTNDFGIVSVGKFSTTVTVRAGGTYYYRAYATNAVSDDWGSPVESFAVPQAAVTLRMAILREDLSVNPLSISGCELWLAADDIDGDGSTEDNPAHGAAIDQWADKSGNSRDATREGSDQTEYNTSGPNGRPVVTFEDDYLSTSYNFDGLTEYTILSVARYTGGDSQRVISSATRNWLFGFHNGGDERFYAEGWIHNTGTANTDWHVHVGHINSDADPKASFWKDGVNLVTDSTGSGNNNYMIGRLGLGGYRNGNEESKCEIAEVVIYNRVLTAEEMDQVGLYLGWKYGLNTPYSDSYPVAVTEERGGFRVTASLDAAAISNVTVNFDFAPTAYGYAEGIRGAIFREDILNDNAINLDGAIYQVSNSRVFTGNKAGTVLALTEDFDNNVIAEGTIQNWNNFPSFDGNADLYATVFCGTIIPRVTGSHTFRGNCDDHSWMYIDMNGDGIWANGDRVYTGDTSGSKTLTAGHPYNFIFMHREGGGGQNINWYVTEPGGAEEQVDTGVQAGMWYYPVPLAAEGSDYTASASSIVIPAGSLSSNITLTVTDDLAQEDDEAVEVSIASLVNATNGYPDRAAGAISSADPEVTNGDGVTDLTAYSATLNGILTMGDEAAVTLYWGDSDGGTSHASWGTTCTVGTLSEDAAFSTNIAGLSAGSTYYYRCYATNGSNLAEDWSDTICFTSTPAAITIADVAVVEGDSGSVSAVFTVTASATSLVEVTVHYETANGIAVAGTDYTAASGTLVFPSGVTSTQITVLVTGDTTFEPPPLEMFVVNLSSPTNCTIADAEAACTITDDDAAGYLADWRYRMKITFDGYAGGETLTDFPALVRLDETIPGFDYGTFASATGGDLRFGNAAETAVLNYEIEKWDTGDESCVWVKLPELPPAGTYIWAYWNNPYDTTVPSYTTDGSTWSEGFAGVYHLSDDMDDATPNRNDGAANGDPVATGTSAIGSAYDLDGNDRVRCPDDASLDLTDALTISGWFRAASWNQWSGILSKGSDNAYELECSGGSTMRMRINNQQDEAPTVGGLSTLTWYYLVGTYDRQNAKIYLNGAESDSRALTVAINQNNTDLSLGDRSNNDYFTGQLDEMRVSSVARSADWIKAEYDNQVAGSTFNTFGTVEGKPSIDIVFGATNLTAFSADLTASLTSTGLAATTVRVYWGDSDGGRVPGSWASNEVMGVVTTVPSNYVKGVSGQADSTQYFYSYAASNVYGTTWAPTNYYTFGRPAINNGAGADPEIGYAILYGNMVSTGGAPTTAYIYWGDNDGGETKGAWDHAITNGTTGQGAFSVSTPTNLLYGVTYYYRCYAENMHGDGWAPATTIFETDSPSGPPSELPNVPEASGFDIVYELDIPTSAAWNANAIPYAIDNSGSIADGSFPRVAYYMELVTGGVTDWVYVAMNTFTTEADKLGVPNTASGEFWHYGITGPITDGLIRSSSGSITTGDDVDTINLEFWPSNYGGGNDYGVPGADGGTFDFGDGGASTGAGHGSMQIHNYGAGETLFAYNEWGSGNGDIGIGNQPSGNPDWTFGADVGTYDSRLLRVLAGDEFPELISIANTSATNIGAAAATVQATLEGTGSVFDVWVYWGESDGGAAEGAWAHTNHVGWFTNALSSNVTYSVSPLSGFTTYHYTFRAMNDSTNLWASPSASFRTRSAFEWSGALDDAWGTAGNWLGGDVPDSPGEYASFTGAGAGSVDLNGSSYSVDFIDISGGNYVFTNSGAAATLTAGYAIQSAGSNTVSLTLSMTGTVEVAGGTLVLGDVDDVSAGGVTLSGGNLTVDGDPAVLSSTTALQHQGYNYNDDNDLDLDGGGGVMAVTPDGTALLTDGPSGRGLDFDNDQDFIDTGAIGQADNYMNLFIGFFTPAESGTFGFRSAGDDDRSGVWLDLNHNGVFESTTPGLGSDRGEQLAWEDTANKQVTLTAGQPYMIAFTHREGGGGSRCDFRFTTPSAAEAIIKPSDAAQAGMWSLTDYQLDATSVGPITVATDSTLRVAIPYGGARFSAVTLSSGTLTLTADYWDAAAHRFASLSGAGSLNVEDPARITLDSASSFASLVGTRGSVTGAAITASGQLDLEPTYEIYNAVSGAAGLHVGDDDASDGLVVLAGSNTYSGVTELERGVLRASDGVGLSSNSRLVFNQDNRDQTCILEANGTFARNTGEGAGEVFWERNGGFAAYGGDLTINLHGGASLLWANGVQGFNNVDSLQFGSRTADGVVELVNNIVMGTSTRRVQTIDNLSTKSDVIRFSGDISGDNAGAWFRFHESSGNQFYPPDNFYSTLIELTGNNTYEHITAVEECTLYAVDGVGLPTDSQLRFSGNSDNRHAILMGNGTINRNIGTGTGEVYWESRGGFAARGGRLVITLEGGSQINWGDGNTGFRGQRLQLNSIHADNEAEITNDIDLNNSERHIYVWNNTGTDTDVGILSGDIIGSNSGTYLRKWDTGVLWLRGQNTYSQRTFLDEGVIRIDGVDNLSPNSSFIFDQGDRTQVGVLEGKGSLTTWNIGTIGEAQSFSWDWQHGGFAAYGGPFTVNLEGDVQIDPGSVAIGFDGHALQLGSSTANDTVDFQNDIWLNSRTHRFQAFDNPYSENDRSVYSGDITFTGWGDIEVGGDGTLAMTGTTSIRNTRVYETGTLCFNGTHTGTDQIYTESNQPSPGLGGTGTVLVQNRFDIREQGRLAPGEGGAGTLDVSVTGGNGFRMYDTSSYEWELGASGHDRVDVTAPMLELRDGWKLKLLGGGGVPRADEEYDIFTYSVNCTFTQPELDVSEMPEFWSTNGVSVEIDVVGQRVYITGLYAALGLENLEPSNLTPTTAQLNGTLSCEGNVMDVWAYWGVTDGGTNAGSWTNRALVGTFTNLVAEPINYTAATGLTTNTSYFCTLQATNGSYNIWASPSETFTTVGPPIVDNDGGAAYVDTIGTARLQGTFNDHNRGDVTLCWGLADAGTGSPSDWDHATSIGDQTNAAFWGGISGALYPLTYYYRCYASNDYGVGWAPSATSFAMTNRPPSRHAYPTSGLLGRWTFDDETARDSSGNDYHGVEGGMPVYSTDTHDGTRKCIDMNANGYVTVDDGTPNQSVFDLDVMTIAFWAKEWPADSWGAYVAKRGEGGQGYQVRRNGTSGSNMSFTLRGPGNDDWNANVNGSSQFNNWVHVIATYGDGFRKLYTDNVERGSEARTGAVTDTDPMLSFGCRDNDGLFDFMPAAYSKAFMDDIYIYNRVLDADERSELYADAYVSLMAVTNTQPTGRTFDTSEINATIDITNAIYGVWAYWGVTDGGTVAGNWASNTFIGTYTNVVGLDVSHTVSGLSVDSTNFYAFRLSNAIHSVWAQPSAQIVAMSAPEVDNGAGALVGVGTATLRGNITTGAVGDVYIYWGLSDGGENKGSWDNYELLNDTLEGPFSTAVTAGYGGTYYYRCYVTNAAGHDWADSTENFQTDPPKDHMAAGVIAGSHSGNPWTATPNPGNLGISMAPQCQRRENALRDAHWRANRDDTGTPGPDNTTIIYTGQIYLKDGTTTFAEMCDDRTILRIDGQQLINDGSWNNGVSAQITRGAGWYDLDLRFSNGGGGYGFTGQQNTGAGDSNWNNVQYGFGWTNAAITGENAYDYTYPEDPGDLTVFRHYDPVGVLIEPSIENAAASGLSTTSATFNALFQGTGWVFDVWAYYGETDGRDTPGAWDDSQYVGSFVNVTSNIISTSISGLLPETDYLYTFHITNELTNVWATPSTAFTTLGTLVVSNAAPTLITQTSATINGHLASGGSGDTTIYWGTTDGGTTNGEWERAASFGEVVTPASPSTNVTGLLAGQTYYYRCYATNDVSGVWAGATTNFATGEAEVSIDDVVVTEGDSGAINATFTISLSATSGPMVSVTYNTVNGTAEAGSDYTTKSGVLNMPSGQTSAQVMVVVHGDTAGEYPSENFRLVLSSPVNCTLADSSGTCTITDDDLTESLGRWDCWMKIEFDGYAGSETLENFPALLRLGEHLDGFYYSSLHSADGADLRFVNADRTQLLDYEIDQWGYSETYDTSADMGNASSLPGSASATGGAVTVTGAGSDIWGGSDNCRYAYRMVTGDFDVSCRAANIAGGNNGWRKIGIMARPSLASNARMAATILAPFQNPRGRHFYHRNSDGAGISADEHQVQTPLPAYIRLVRSDQTFSSYGSTDGSMWTQIGSDYTFTGGNVMPATMYLGLAVTSHNTGQLTTTVFDNLSGVFTNRLTDTSHLWVKLPELPPGGTHIWAYWGEQNMTPQASRTNGSVWSEGYEGVWHLSDSIADSTPNSNDGVANGDPSVSAESIIGHAYDFDGNDRIRCPDDDSLDIQHALSLSAWFRLRAGNQWSAIVAKGSDNAYELEFDGTYSVRININNQDDCDANTALALDTWYYVTGTYDRQWQRMYLNGDWKKSQQEFNPINVNTFPLSIGDRYNDDYFVGQIDEVRVSSQVRSADWIKAEYDNQVPGSTFTTYHRATWKPQQSMFILW